MNTSPMCSQLPWECWQEIASFLPNDDCREFAVAKSECREIAIDGLHRRCEAEAMLIFDAWRCQCVKDVAGPSLDARLSGIFRRYQGKIHDDYDASWDAYYAAPLSDHIYKEKHRFFYLRDQFLNTFVDLPTLEGWSDCRDYVDDDMCLLDLPPLGGQLQEYSEQCTLLSQLAAADPDTDITSPAAELLRKMIDGGLAADKINIHLFFRFIDAMPIRIRAWFALVILRSFLDHGDIYSETERVRIITDIIRDYKLADLPQDPYCVYGRVWGPIDVLEALLEQVASALHENAACSTDAQGSSLRVSDSAIYKDFGQVD